MWKSRCDHLVLRSEFFLDFIHFHFLLFFFSLLSIILLERECCPQISLADLGIS